MILSKPDLLKDFARWSAGLRREYNQIHDHHDHNQ